MSTRISLLAAALAAILVPALVLPGPRPAAAGDGVVHEEHLSHLPRFDRTPACPVDGQPFTVRLCAAPGDLEAVQVRLLDGAGGSWVATDRVSRPHRDEWVAQVPATGAAVVRYYFVVADGGAARWVGPQGVLATPPPDSGWTMDRTTLAHAPRGATPLEGGGAVFRVWAPSNTGAIAQGEFNGWVSTTPMTHVGDDFVARVPAAQVGQQYKFQFSNGYWNPDPWGTGLRDDGYGGYNSLVDTTAFAWQDAGFAAPAGDRMVVYALYTEEFAGLNDPLGTPAYPSRLADVTARLGHLQELGVNAVLLSPVTETSGPYPYGGYQPLSQWAVESSLGSATRLRELVQAAHGRGMAVMLDLVWTHMAFLDDFLWGYGGYQDWYPTPPAYGNLGPQLDYARDEVREHLLESALRWVEEFHVDGLRVYGVPVMASGQQAVAGAALLRDLNDLLGRRGHTGLTLADVPQRDAAVTGSTALGGLGFGAQTDHQCAQALRAALPLAGTGTLFVGGLAGALLDGGPALGAGALHRFLEMPHEAWMNQSRVAADLAAVNGAGDADVQARLRLGMGLVMTAPGIPGLLMGDEWIETTPMFDDAAGRIDWGRKVTFRPFFDFVSSAVRLRASEDALRAGAAMEWVQVDEAADVLVFRRHSEGREVLVAANLGAVDRPAWRVGVPVAGVWRERLDSADPLWGGDGPTNPGDLHTEAVPADGQPQSLVLALPRLGLAVLGPLASLDAPPAPALAARLGLARVTPNPVTGAACVDVTLARAGTVTLALHDVAGRRLARVAEVALGPGTHRVRWDVAGLRLAPGLYVLAAECAGERARRKVAVLR
jgi:1,4-alpha-glucan branching enzyme